MNNYKQGRIFNQALNEADTLNTDMSAEDWAKMCGLMHDYGHGYEFEEFTKEEAIKKIEAIAEEQSRGGGIMKYDVKDLNAPSRWNMRIWDDDNGEWLCQSDKNALTYYGFDITGGEITEFQGLPKWHAGRHLIWEQSTGLKDKNGKEIYEGDIVEALIDGVWNTGKNSVGFGKVKWKLEVLYNDIRYMDVFRVIGSKNAPDRIYYLFDKELSELEVIGNIHENKELLEAKDVD